MWIDVNVCFLSHEIKTNKSDVKNFEMTWALLNVLENKDLQYILLLRYGLTRHLLPNSKKVC